MVILENNNQSADSNIAEIKSGTLCAICQADILPSDTDLISCPDCQALYHKDCWEENRGCAVYGCSRVPDTEQYNSVEIPVAYWGQEDKPCPDCGKTILAAAVRCRHCGTVFESAAPMDKRTYNRLNENNRRFPQMRKNVILLLIFCMTPFSAPFAAVIGSIWYKIKKVDILAMPSPYPGICRFGIYAAACQTIIIVLMLILNNLIH